jgi:hypothetical protein
VGNCDTLALHHCTIAPLHHCTMSAFYICEPEPNPFAQALSGSAPANRSPGAQTGPVDTAALIVGAGALTFKRYQVHERWDLIRPRR